MAIPRVLTSLAILAVGALDLSVTTTLATAQTPPALVLDFETSATGLDIISTPLVTPDGTITASAVGGRFFLLTGSGGTNILLHDQQTEGDYGQLAFDFDVASITFHYDGFSAGEFLAEALDSDLNVLDSFFDPDTAGGNPGGPVTLSGLGIRFFRFQDTNPDRISAGIDNVAIVPSVTDQIDAVTDAVAALEAQGTLPAGLANALAVKLEAASNQADRQPQAAIGQLNAFIRQVTALVQHGVLTFAEGKALIDAARTIIVSLGG